MYHGKKRLLYGTKWNAVANVKITVIKQNRSDFTVADCRNAYRWLTGNSTASWLDLYEGDQCKYSFLCTVQDVKQQKIDARTVGLNIYFESVSPWAYSAQHTIKCVFGELLQEDGSGTIYKGDDVPLLNITSDGVLYDGMDGGAGVFDVSEEGLVSLNKTMKLKIDNQTDDLYTYIPLNILFQNSNSRELSIKNLTLDEETKITNLSLNETIQLRPEQFILSDVPYKIFGNTFNFVWPRLAPGINEIEIDGNGGRGQIEFSYRHPVKIGDCAIDIYVPNNNGCMCPDNTDYGMIAWDDIVGTPDTIAGYGIKDAYTIAEVDEQFSSISDINLDKASLDNMLSDILKD